MPAYAAKYRSNPMRIKTAFVSAILKQNAKAIQQEQNQVVDEWKLYESGKLKSSLRGRFSVDNKEGGGKLSMRYLAYARFLDIHLSQAHKRAGFHLYNRIVFGTLYGQILPSLRFGFTIEVQKQIKQSIAGTAPGSSFYKMRDAQISAIKEEYSRNTAAIVSKQYRQGYY